MDTKTLIEKAIEGSSLDSAQGRKIIEALSELIAEKGAELDAVAVPGFGVFEPKKRLERINVHPSTGRRMLLPPKIVLAFKPSALLKQKFKET